MFPASIRINPATTAASLLIIYPPLISVLAKLVGVPLPSYLLVLAISMLLLVAGLNLSLRPQRGSPVWSVYLAYLGLCLVSLTYTPARIAAEQKLANIAYVLIVPLLSIVLGVGMQPMSLLEYYEKLERTLMRHIFFCSGLFSVLFILFRYEESAGRYIMPGIDNPIWVSRYFGASLVGTAYALFRAHTQSRRYAVGGFGLVLLAELFMSGSKTPFFSVFVVMCVMLYSRKVSVLLLIKITAVIALVLVPVIYFASGSYILETEFFSLFYRLEALGQVSESHRIWLGNGIASYGPLVFNEDAEAYPHNMYLEAYFELGIAGLGLMLLLTAMLVRSYRGRLIDLLAIYFWINANMSGDIAGNATFFTVAYIAIMTASRHEAAGHQKRTINITEKKT